MAESQESAALRAKREMMRELLTFFVQTAAPPRGAELARFLKALEERNG